MKGACITWSMFPHDVYVHCAVNIAINVDCFCGEHWKNVDCLQNTTTTEGTQENAQPFSTNQIRVFLGKIWYNQLQTNKQYVSKEFSQIFSLGKI